MKHLFNVQGLQVVQIKPHITNRKHFFDTTPYEEVDTLQMDKDFMSIMKEILVKNKETLEVWNVFYPIRSAYIPTLTNLMLNVGYYHTTLKVLNNLVL